MRRREMMMRPAGSSTRTLTVTLAEPSPSSSSSSQPPETLVLRLSRAKKKVTWKEGTVDNEFLQRKSSKKCCIFHKEKPFDEDDSDGEDEANCRSHDRDGAEKDGAGTSGCCSHDGERPSK